MNIRRYQKGEEDKLYDIFSTSIKMNAKEYYTSEQLDAWAPVEIDIIKWKERIMGINPYVVIDDDEIIGYADLQSNGYIDHFFIKGGYANKGVGRFLMKHLISKANEEQIEVLFADVSLAAQEFFEKFGFKIIERKKVNIRGIKLENALMKLHVSAKDFR